jgi:plasmid stabilization system protein ParE
MKVHYMPRARGDIDAILSYIDQRNPQGARNVARIMHKTIELIGQFPQAGRSAGEQGTRVLPVGAIHTSSIGASKATRPGSYISGTPPAGRGTLIGDSPSYLKE